MAENRIKAVLADKKKTCRWLAQEIEMSENTVSRWCSNKMQPSLSQLDKVAAALDVDIRELLRPTKEALLRGSIQNVAWTKCRTKYVKPLVHR